MNAQKTELTKILIETHNGKPKDCDTCPLPAVYTLREILRSVKNPHMPYHKDLPRGHFSLTTRQCASGTLDYLRDACKRGGEPSDGFAFDGENITREDLEAQLRQQACVETPRRYVVT